MQRSSIEVAYRLSSMYETLFLKALDGYLQGRGKPLRTSPGEIGVGFDHELEKVISTRLHLEEQLLMRVSSAARSRALSEARSDHLRIARQALDESLGVLALPTLSDEAKLIIKSFHEAVEAYLEYKHKRYDTARRRVFDALEHDGVLVTRYGYKILELHRIQLAHNLMRIQVREGQLERAGRFCSDLLHYIEGDIARWPIPEFTCATRPADLPVHLRGAMFIQIVGEVALLLTGRPTSEAVRIFAPLIPLAEAKPSAHGCYHERAREWLRAKRAFISGSTETFLDRVTALLRDGPGEIPLLWRAAVTDLYEISCCFQSDTAHALCREIAADARDWRLLPKQLRSQFEGKALSR